VGAAIGATAGMLRDIYVAGVNTDFLEDASTALTPGEFAVLADISEEWITPVDTRMEALGGSVFRTAREHFEEERRTKELAALRPRLPNYRLNTPTLAPTARRKFRPKLTPSTTNCKTSWIRPNRGQKHSKVKRTQR